MNSKFSYTGASPVERMAEAAPTEETGEQTGEQRVADRNAQSVKETLRFHKQKTKKVADKEQTDSINSGLYEAKHGASSSVNSQGGHLNLPAPPPGLTEQDRTDRLRCYPTLFHVCCPHHKSCRYCEATCCRTDPAHTSHRCRVHLHW